MENDFIISKYQIHHSEDEYFPPFRINPEKLTLTHQCSAQIGVKKFSANALCE